MALTAKLGRIGQGLPVAFEGALARLGVDDQAMARRELFNAVEQRAWRGRGRERQI